MDENGWTSVDEGIPGCGEYIIGATQRDDGTWYIHSGCFRLHRGMPFIERITGCHSISHWMILPKPPVSF